MIDLFPVLRPEQKIKKISNDFNRHVLDLYNQPSIPTGKKYVHKLMTVHEIQIW